MQEQDRTGLWQDTWQDTGFFPWSSHAHHVLPGRALSYCYHIACITCFRAAAAHAYASAPSDHSGTPTHAPG